MMFSRFPRISQRLAVLAAVGLMLASSLALAGNVQVNSQGTVLPYRGMYFEHGHGGTGLTVDVDKNGYVFAVFYAYDKDGRPTYYLMEGMYQANDPDTMIHTGVIGTLDTGAYVSENGQCVGTDCPYRNPDRSDAHLPVHLTWSSPRKLHIELGTQSWDVTAEQYTATDEDYLTSSDWIRISTLYDTDGTDTESEVSSVRITKTTLQASQFGGCPQGTLPPANYLTLPSDAVIYSYIEGYGYSDFFYLSSGTQSSGYFSVTKCSGGYGRPALPGSNLLITGPNGFRVYYEAITGSGPTENHVIVEDRLIRMPEGSKLYQQGQIGF